MMVHIALTAVGRWFAHARGRAVSLVVLGHQGGEATLPLLFVAASGAMGWRSGWLLGAAALLLIALPLTALAFRTPRIPRGTPVADGVTADSWTRGRVLRDPIFWTLLVGVLAPPFIGTTIFFHQDYLTALQGWPATAFPSAFTLMAVTTVGIALLNGWLIDRFSAKAVLSFFLLPLAAACFCAGLTEAVWGLYAFMFLLGVSYGFSSTLFGALWPEIYGTAHLGAIRSAMMPFMVFATAAGPGLTGTLIDRGVALPDQLVTMGAYCLAASAVMATASVRLRRRGQAPATMAS
jgi:MFS family permease